MNDLPTWYIVNYPEDVSQNCIEIIDIWYYKTHRAIIWKSIYNPEKFQANYYLLNFDDSIVTNNTIGFMCGAFDTYKEALTVINDNAIYHGIPLFESNNKQNLYDIIYQDKPHTIWYCNVNKKYFLTSPHPHDRLWSNSIDVLKDEITKRKTKDFENNNNFIQIGFEL